ncbi:hypothetical protein PAAG_11040 [Paracoccidioides lutzii Pb01]|uniref:Uncharacterized protein n=1 Tax=Paracoccidioides lutzii (strain ATCC MYA-826 / Pb01) TaxID=502779 RepID=A0A0A2V2T0_PARBA|nr:hypothetical protein PAAG_11040 [Paracoccidioides lutzii Pb01]KGQ02091.1 hypothetical protein PAAG_11040 [Paracoccidioides lutzii Pb01]
MDPKEPDISTVVTHTITFSQSPAPNGLLVPATGTHDSAYGMLGLGVMEVVKSPTGVVARDTSTSARATFLLTPNPAGCVLNARF